MLPDLAPLTPEPSHTRPASRTRRGHVFGQPPPLDRRRIDFPTLKRNPIAALLPPVHEIARSYNVSHNTISRLLAAP